MSSHSDSPDSPSLDIDEMVEAYALLLEEGKTREAEEFYRQHRDNVEFVLLAETLSSLRAGRSVRQRRGVPAKLTLAIAVLLFLVVSTLVLVSDLSLRSEVSRFRAANSLLQQQLADAQVRLREASVAQQQPEERELFNIAYPSVPQVLTLTVLGSIEERPNDRVLIEFGRPLDSLRQQHEFGIFSDPQLEGQKIEEGWADVPLAKGGTAGALHLQYEVAEHYNGWWLRPSDSDWSDYEAGSLVIRLRPGSICTSLFRLELKVADRQSTGTVIYPAVVRIAKEHWTAAQEAGFADVSVPLRAFGAPELRAVRELVIVFQGVRIDPLLRRGDLFIRSIRLSQFSDIDSEEIQPLGKPEGVDNSDDILDDLGQKAFAWFRDHRHAKTGLLLDRSPNSGVRTQINGKASIASTGYYLSLLPEAVRLDYVAREEARRQARETLAFVQRHVPHHHGMLFHFVDWETGERWPESEVSLLDSAIFFNGAMVVAQFFGEDVAQLANTLLDRADWREFIVAAPDTGAKLLALGWTPEQGLLGAMDVRSSEFAMPYFLAVGSRTNPIDPQLWYNTSVQYGLVAGETILNNHHPLFTSHSGLGWHDLRGLVDRQGVDLDANARKAALANRAFCRLLASQYPSYRKDVGAWWGISAGDTPAGYLAFGPIWGDSDGTVFSYPALAALPWIEDELREDLLRWRSSKTWAQVNGEYGLAPFNLATASGAWIGRDVIGVDLGSFAASLANHRNETIWKLWMEHPVAKSALQKLEYRPAEASRDVRGVSGGRNRLRLTSIRGETTVRGLEPKGGTNVVQKASGTAIGAGTT